MSSLSLVTKYRSSLWQNLLYIVGSPLMLGLVLFSYLVFGLVFSGWISTIWFIVGMIICVIPGWSATKLLYGIEFAKRLDSLGHTFIFGLLIETFISVIIAIIFGQLTIVTMLIGAFGSTILLLWLDRWISSLFSFALSENDPATTRMVVTVGLLMVLVIIAIPFMNVGREVSESYAYAPYFSRDHLRSLAFSAALSKGIVPPSNPYFIDEPLHYYWFQMVFPALVYRLSNFKGDLEAIFLLSTLFVNVAFVFVFVHLLRQFIKNYVALLLVLVLAFLSESYQAPFKAILTFQPTHWALEGTWLGAIILPPVGYFFQSLLYLPHHFAALTAFLVVISLLVEQQPQSQLKRVNFAAIILILSGGFSFFMIAYGFLWAGSYLALRGVIDLFSLIKEPQSSQKRVTLITTILSGIILGIAGLATYGLLDYLGMLLDGATNSASLKLDKFQLMAPIHFLVMLGPMFLLGIAGIVISFRQSRLRAELLAIFWLLISVFFLVDLVLLENLPYWEVSQKLGTILRISVLIFSGIWLDYFIVKYKNLEAHKFAWSILLLLCVSGIPNLLAYEYVHLDINNSRLLTYVSKSERVAADWIRENTPLDAVVQSWPGGQGSAPHLQGQGIFSLIPVFGERQSAIGDPEFSRYYMPRHRYSDVDDRAAEISQIYTNPQSSTALQVLNKYEIDYVYWGVSEQECCSANLHWYENSAMFDKVYNEAGVSIFYFNPK